MSGRIRTIKPELLEDAVTAGITDAAFRLYIGALLVADDHGNLRADPRKLRGDVFWAHDEVATEAVEFLLMELWLAGRSSTGPGLLFLYTARGQRYAHVRNWEKHQKIDRRGNPRLPKPDDKEAEEYRPTSDFSTRTRRALATDLDLDHDLDHDHDPPLVDFGKSTALVVGAGSMNQEAPVQPEALSLPAPNASAQAPAAIAPTTVTQLALVVAPEPASATVDAIELVYEHYVAAWRRHVGGIRAPKLDAKRRKAIAGRLKERFTVAELQAACDGVFLSPFHMGDNDRKKRYVDLDLVCRDAKRVEDFAALAHVVVSEQAARGSDGAEADYAPPTPAEAAELEAALQDLLTAPRASETRVRVVGDDLSPERIAELEAKRNAMIAKLREAGST